MPHSLRTRLLASYVAILLITLVVIGLALLVFLQTRPLPLDGLIRELTATLLDVRIAEVMQIGVQLGQGSVHTEVNLLLSDEAAARDVRLLVVNGRGGVEFDSAGALDTGTRLVETERAPVIDRPVGRAVMIYQGQFQDTDGHKWVYVSQPLRPILSQPGSGALLLVAAPVPHPALSSLFQSFGESFFRPLVQAGLVGLLIAVGLSILIARSVARPLQRMSAAAGRIAHGDLRQRVPEDGPSEVRALAAAFNEMAARVAASQHAQRDFIANVSHDLRTPLTSIQGFSQAIAEGVTSDPVAAQHAAQIIHDEAARLHRMVESLLDIARIESGQLAMQRRPVAVEDVLRAVVESLSVRAEDAGIRLTLEAPPRLPRVSGDGDRLAQVFTNLLDNAIRHTPGGGEVAVRAMAAPGTLIVMVHDTGEGIPIDELPRIFERFYQVDKSRQRTQRAGSGLGLAISQQIIEAHGGRIDVASAEGAGTTFTVWLPLDPGAA